MNASPNKILADVFGYTSFRGDQETVINLILAGGDALVLMPTGGGKSLCYQIPAIMRAGVGIVVSPLIALMQDQVSAMQQLGVRSTFINSTLDSNEALRREALMRRNEFDLVYVAPERLMTERFLECLDHTSLGLFAIDEAHCVSQWGHDFRPEYIQLSALKKRFPQIPCIALTATADTPTRKEIIDRLGLNQVRVFASSFNRPNIRYRVLQKDNPRQQLLRFLRDEHPEDSGIVYCLSRKRVEEVASLLSDNQFEALPYHAGLPASQRETHQHHFLRNEKTIIVATIAFGMGIDKPNVRFVAHLDMPKSIEAYYQETGRAGRDGLSSDAWMTYGFADVVMLRQLLAGSNAEERIKRIERHKLDAMLGYCETTRCRRHILLGYFGEKTPDTCENCDTCVNPVSTWDGTVAAQKAMSCVYRTGQRFGVSYLVDVLLGKENARIVRFGHDRISTYGIGTDLDGTQWKSVFRQLVSAGLLAVDIEGHGGLKLTENSRPVLKGKETILFRTDPIKSARPERRSRPTKPSLMPQDDEAKALWEALRSLRFTLAEDQKVPPYVIFHDTTLNDIVTYRPRDSEELQQMSGIGQTKLERYGEAILSAIEEHQTQWIRPDHIPPIPTLRYEIGAVDRAAVDTTETTLALIRKGKTPEQVATERGFKNSTIYSHLAKAIEAGDLEVGEVIDLATNELLTIESIFKQMGTDSPFALKPIFEKLNAKYDYDVLRCIRAGMIVRGDFPH